MREANCRRGHRAGWLAIVHLNGVIDQANVLLGKRSCLGNALGAELHLWFRPSSTCPRLRFRSACSASMSGISAGSQAT
eukprot:1789235-Amphidinium_carterae.1